jgi:hypothetical protein
LVRYAHTLILGTVFYKHMLISRYDNPCLDVKYMLVNLETY